MIVVLQLSETFPFYNTLTHFIPDFGELQGQFPLLYNSIFILKKQTNKQKNKLFNCLDIHLDFREGNTYPHHEQ